MCFIEIMELASDMSPTCDLSNPARFIEPIESRKRIRLQPTAECGEMIRWMLGLPIWRVCKPNRWRLCAASGSIIANVSPQAARLRFPVSGSQHGHRYIVGVNLHRIQNVFPDRIHQWLQCTARAADPTRQRGAIQLDA